MDYVVEFERVLSYGNIRYMDKLICSDPFSNRTDSEKSIKIIEKANSQLLCYDPIVRPGPTDEKNDISFNMTFNLALMLKKLKNQLKSV